MRILVRVGASAAKIAAVGSGAVTKSSTDRTNLSHDRFMLSPEVFVECRLLDLIDVAVGEKCVRGSCVHRGALSQPKISHQPRGGGDRVSGSRRITIDGF